MNAATSRKIAGSTVPKTRLLVDLLRQDLVRDLVLAPDGAEAAVGLEHAVERLDRRPRGGAALAGAAAPS